MQYEPAHSIIEKFGGPEAVAQIVDATAGQVRRWRRSREKGGTGGIIPHWHIPALLAVARDRRIKVRAEDFAPHIEVAA